MAGAVRMARGSGAMAESRKEDEAQGAPAGQGAQGPGAERPVMLYHLGAPFTDENALTWSLRKEGGGLVERGFHVRRPASYRAHLERLLERLDGAPLMPADQERLIALMTRERPARRIFYASPHFLGRPAWIFQKGIFYPNAAAKARALANLFPEHESEFFIAISNPALFIARAFHAQKKKSWEKFLAGADPFSVRWSDVIARIRAACPEVALTVWCHEDAPVIWRDVLGAVTGLGPERDFAGALDMIAPIITARGAKILRAFLARHPGITPAQRRRLLYRILDSHVLEEATEEEIDLPGWTLEQVARMSEIYEEDTGRIAAMPGVRLILP